VHKIVLLNLCALSCIIPLVPYKKYTLKQAATLLNKDYVGKVFSVKQAAQRIGVSESHCRRLLESGKIRGTKLGHDWVVRNLDYKRKRKPKKG
jgi:excisionase family DNA binding protein